MRATKRLLLALMVLLALGAALPVMAGQNLDGTPNTVDWRFAGPRIRPPAHTDSVWETLVLAWDVWFLPTFVNSDWF